MIVLWRSKVKTASVSLIFFTFLLSSAALGALTAPVDRADWTGYLSTNRGDVLATGPWGSSFDGSGLRITWDITQTADSYHYVYAMSNEVGGPMAKDLNFLILEVGDNFANNNMWNVAPGLTHTDPQIFDIGPTSPSNPAYYSFSLYGVQIVTSDLGDWSLPVISFDSDCPPIWGSFYARDGRYSDLGSPADVFAHTLGEIGGSRIPVPGGPPEPPPIPAPSALLLTCSGLAAIAARRGQKP